MFDGMDVSKTYLPREKGTPNKDLDKYERLKTHTMGAICDGMPLPVAVLVHVTHHYPNDANLTVTALHQILVENANELRDMMQQAEEERQEEATMTEEELEKHRAKKKEEGNYGFGNTRWPNTLFLQLDNASQNKSNCLFHYCAWLVYNRVFEKIRLSFMMVGHTHDIVDQLFSRISR